MYTPEEQAIRLVIKAFEGQKRLKEDINTSVHSLTVGYMLKDIGANENIVLGGFLHDIIEDTSYDYIYLENNFGQKVAEIVLAVSENQSIENWKERKEDFLKRMRNANEEVLLVELSDKLHNLLSDYETWKTYGYESLKTAAASAEDNKWYYQELKIIFNEKLKNNKLLERHNEITKLYFDI